MKKLGKSNSVLYHLAAADFTIRVVSATEAWGETVCYHMSYSWHMNCCSSGFSDP
jgi:hypothetical protein